MAKRFPLLVFLSYLSSATAYGQVSASLRTSETQIELKADATSPRLERLAFPGEPPWNNEASESLVSFVEIAGKELSCHWSFNAVASRLDGQEVSFVYDSAAPHLRLTWSWRARHAYGPIEHQIRIENLENQELWIPMQDSLSLNFRVEPENRLEHFFVEKGANSPSPAGTHRILLNDGYRWTGTSSTYGDLRDLITRRFADGAVVGLRPQDPLSVAYTRMRLYDISQAPVIEGNRIVGIIDESDLLLATAGDASSFARVGARPSKN